MTTRGCALVPPEARLTGNCEWCGGKLPLTKRGVPAKRRRWCSKVCSKQYLVNHSWNHARRGAIDRDSHSCVNCGFNPSKLTPPTHDKYDSPEEYRVALQHHDREVKRRKLEVHHVIPRAGRRDKVSCLHHLANLRTLCHDCHRDVHCR